MNKVPYISIVTASYNAEKYLQTCIDSVAQQTFPYREHLIDDGSSQDGTLEIIKNNADRLSWWVSEQDTGIYQAWNKALRHAKGEWILFLGADDRLANPYVLEKIVPHLKNACPDYRLVYGKLNLINASGRILKTVGEPWKEYKGKYEHGRIKLPAHPETFHHRSLFEQKNFDESFRIAGDSEFLIRELKKRPALFVPELITTMTFGGTSGSPKNTLLRWKECHSIMKKHKLKIPLPVLIWQRIKNLSEFAIFSIFRQKTAYKLFDMIRQLSGKEKYWT